MIPGHEANPVAGMIDDELANCSIPVSPALLENRTMLPPPVGSKVMLLLSVVLAPPPGVGAPVPTVIWLLPKVKKPQLLVIVPAVKPPPIVVEHGDVEPPVTLVPADGDGVQRPPIDGPWY